MRCARPARIVCCPAPSPASSWRFCPSSAFRPLGPIPIRKRCHRVLHGSLLLAPRANSNPKTASPCSARPPPTPQPPAVLLALDPPIAPARTIAAILSCASAATPYPRRRQPVLHGSFPPAPAASPLSKTAVTLFCTAPSELTAPGCPNATIPFFASTPPSAPPSASEACPPARLGGWA